MPTNKPAFAARLRDPLEALYQKYHTPGYLNTDPLRYPHRFADPRDQEVVALIAALLAYGRVELIFRAIDRVLAVLGPKPHQTLLSLTPARARKQLNGFRHRFNTGPDIAFLLIRVRRLLEQYGSLEQAFLAGDEPEAPTLHRALDRFVSRLLEAELERFYPAGAPSGGLKFLLADPGKGSACKRWNLFLRWMVRPADGLDLGLWQQVSPARLTLPLDTHTHQIGRFIGLTDRSTCDWKAAEQATARLRWLDPADPVRYDFAICRIGIVGDCMGMKIPSVCNACALEPVCTAPLHPTARP